MRLPFKRKLMPGTITAYDERLRGSGLRVAGAYRAENICGELMRCSATPT